MKRSRIIALSGISCAMSLICVVGSIYVEFMTLTFAVLSAIFLQMPLTQNYWLGGVLAYVSTSILAFLIGNINALPFILFFGAYAILQWLLEYKLQPKLSNKIVSYSVVYLIKIAYFEAIAAIIWFLFNALVPTLVIFGKAIKLTYLIIALAGIPIFLLYDIMMHLVFKNFAIIIKKVVNKTSKTTTPDDIMYDGGSEDNESNIFNVANEDDNSGSGDKKNNIFNVANKADNSGSESVDSDDKTEVFDNQTTDNNNKENND